ncbi:hypothetical protein [Paenibacillus dendritiformis]|nr:hypothetical protein [Paenibacillus dendritiformis]
MRTMVRPDPAQPDRGADIRASLEQPLQIVQEQTGTECHVFHSHDAEIA